jgi:hypothetical protein
VPHNLPRGVRSRPLARGHRAWRLRALRPILGSARTAGRVAGAVPAPDPGAGRRPGGGSSRVRDRARGTAAPLSSSGAESYSAGREEASRQIWDSTYRR